MAMLADQCECEQNQEIEKKTNQNLAQEQRKL